MRTAGGSRPVARVPVIDGVHRTEPLAPWCGRTPHDCALRSGTSVDHIDVITVFPGVILRTYFGLILNREDL
jgi:hypothetical protein